MSPPPLAGSRVTSSGPAPRNQPEQSLEIEPDTAAQLLASIDEGEAKVSLVVDGAEVPLGPFVRRILAAGISGMVSQLKGVPEVPERIELVVERD